MANDLYIVQEAKIFVCLSHQGYCLKRQDVHQSNFGLLLDPQSFLGHSIFLLFPRHNELLVPLVLFHDMGN